MYFARGASISTLRFLGRWTVERSLEHYIQLAMSTQIIDKISPEAIARLKKAGPPVFGCDSAHNLRTPFARLKSAQKTDGQALVTWCRTYAELAD